MERKIFSVEWQQKIKFDLLWEDNIEWSLSLPAIFLFSTLFKDLWAVFLLSKFFILFLLLFSCFWLQVLSTSWVLQKTLKLQNMSGQVFNIFQPIKVQRNMKCKLTTHNCSNHNEVQYHSHQNDRIQRHTKSNNHGRLWRSYWTNEVQMVNQVAQFQRL